MASNFQNQSEFHPQLLELLHEFSRFGQSGSGGITRLAASLQDKQARDYLCAWLGKHNFSVLIDPVGNIFGILDLGESWPAHYFFCGSHLDSQPEGGNYDGTLGVVCACIAALSLKQQVARDDIKPTYRYFVVCNWTGEEGARFQPSLIGSSTFAGSLDLDEAWKVRDADGINLKDALEAIGYLGSDQGPQSDRYLELHIEQGTRLENAGDAIGLVDACWGAKKLRVTVRGKADHTGPTPMANRRNALLAASRLVMEVETISQDCPETLHSSVGRMELAPNSPNTVVAEALLWIEFRSVSDEAIKSAVVRLKQNMETISEQTGCDLFVVSQEHRDVVRFDESALDDAAQTLVGAQTRYQRLDTIAGHDAIRLQAVCPSTLLFVPSQGGITHSPLEFTADEDVCAGFDGMIAVLSSLISQPVDNNTSRRLAQ